MYFSWRRHRDDARGVWPGLDPVWNELGIAARGGVLLAAVHSLSDDLSEGAIAAITEDLVRGISALIELPSQYRPTNWQFMSACHLFAVGHLMPDAPKSAMAAELGSALIRTHLDHSFLGDGGHIERSPAYHLMCLQKLQYCLAVDDNHGAGLLREHPAVLRAHYWLLDMSTEGGWIAPIQDSAIIWISDVISVGALLLDDARLRDAARDYGKCQETQSPGAANGGGPREVIPSVHLRSSGYVVLRARRGWHVILDVGRLVPHELESHSHRSKLSLIAVVGDAPCIWEAGGPPDYDEPAYHTWYQSAQAHSTLIHAAGVDFAEGGSRVRAFGQVDGISALVSDCSLGEGTWTRTVILLDGEEPSLVVIDSFAGPIDPSEWLLVWQGVAFDGQSAENRPGTRERLALASIGAIRVVVNWPDLRTSIPDRASPSGASPGTLEPHVFWPTSNDVVTFFPRQPLPGTSLLKSQAGWRNGVGRASGRVVGWALDGELVVASDVVVRCSSADLILWSQEDGRFRAVLTVGGPCEVLISHSAARMTLDGITQEGPPDGRIRLEGAGTFVIEGT